VQPGCAGVQYCNEAGARGQPPNRQVNEGDDRIMKKRWEKPQFEHVPLGAEVTAYLGSTRSPQ